MPRVLLAVVLLLVAARPVAPKRRMAKLSTSSTVRRAMTATLPRMPSREALRGFTPESVETALSSFTMRRQGGALSRADAPRGRRVRHRAPGRVVPRAAGRHPEERLLQRHAFRRSAGGSVLEWVGR